MAGGMVPGTVTDGVANTAALDERSYYYPPRLNRGCVAAIRGRSNWRTSFATAIAGLTRLAWPRPMASRDFGHAAKPRHIGCASRWRVASLSPTGERGPAQPKRSRPASTKQWAQALERIPSPMQVNSMRAIRKPSTAIRFGGRIDAERHNGV